MSDPEKQLEEIFLKPGEAYISREPAILSTLLGSCVGITFWTERLGVGALCHAMLPNCPQISLCRVSSEVGYRYVDFAIRTLAHKFDEFGVLRSEVQVKLFGGADVLTGSDQAPGGRTVGEVNCDTAQAILRVEGFRIAASSVRGDVGVKIRFNTVNGEVQLRRLQQNQDAHGGKKRAGGGVR